MNEGLHSISNNINALTNIFYGKLASINNEK